MGAQQWLPALPVSSGGTALAVGEEAIYVAFNRRIARLALDGGPEQHLANTAGDVHDLVLAGPLVAAMNPSNGLLSLDPDTGAIIDSSQETYASYGLSGLSAAPSRNRIFGRSQGLYPSDLVAELLDGDGEFTDERDSPEVAGISGGADPSRP